MAKYTDKEIKDIKRWRGEGLTWAEIQDRNGRPAKAMSAKFSKMTLGVPEYKEPKITPIVIPDNVKSINERNTVTAKRRILKDYTVVFDFKIKYESLEEAAKLVKKINELTEVSIGYSGSMRILETNEIEI